MSLQVLTVWVILLQQQPLNHVAKCMIEYHKFEDAGKLFSVIAHHLVLTQHNSVDRAEMEKRLATLFPITSPSIYMSCDLSGDMWRKIVAESSKAGS